MAVVRTARSSPPYALIIFIFLWIVSTGLAAYFYVEGGKKGEEADRARRELDAIATGTERLGPVKTFQENANQVNARGAKPATAIGQATFEVDRLKSKLVGSSANVSVPELVRDGGYVDQQIADLGRVSGVKLDGASSLLSAAQQLASVAASSRSAAAQAQSALAKANTELKAAVQARETLIADSKKAVDQMRADVGALAKQLAQRDAEVSEANNQRQAEINRLQDNYEKQIRNFLTQIADLKSAVDAREKQVSDLKKEIEMVKTPPKIAVGTDAAGRIVRASVGAKEVWINRGSKDRVTPGMTFAVYDPKTGITLTSDTGKKGDIEVVEVGEGQSMARITHLEKGQLINPNDVIANLAYSADPNRKYRFVVYGDFDLDGDSVATPQEREKILRLIGQWGGVVEDKLTSQTDFLVLGAEPANLTTHMGSDSEQGQDLAKTREGQQSTYQALQLQARSFAIPVLNANRFLSLIGYYAPTVVRYQGGVAQP